MCAPKNGAAFGRLSPRAACDPCAFASTWTERASRSTCIARVDGSMARRLTLLLGLVPIVGVAELALHQYFAARAPGFDAYAALAPELKKLKQPGMPVVVAPRWAE